MQRQFDELKPSDVSGPLGQLLREASDEKRILEIKYRRLLGQRKATEQSLQSALDGEERMRTMQVRLMVLEDTERRCFSLEQQLEALRRQPSSTPQLCQDLQAANDTVASLRDEFDALNDSNTRLLEKVATLDRERRTHREREQVLLQRIADLESINRTLEEMAIK
jgi:chromosome segregation ATPase